MKKRLIVILMLVIMLASINVNALSTSIGALIYGKETKSTYGHVMSYRKTSSEDLNRNQYFFISGINQYQKSLNFITQDPNDNIQSFKKDTLEISLEYNDNNVKLEDIRAIGKLDFKFYVSQDYINYVDVSDAVVYDNDSHTYHYNGDLKAYKVEFINKTNGTVDDKIYVEINHQIKLDYSNMNEDQKAGKQKLNNWLDTKNANQPPISNGQNIFNIQPIIKGEIKYQRLENDNIPTWLSAINKANIPLNLYEKNGEELIKIGSTTTDNTGSFAFSNYEANAGSFYINDTSNDLYIGLGDTQYKEWLVSGVDGIDVSLLNNKKLRLGKITDISKHQDVFEQAFGRTVWQDGFQNKDEAAKKATTLKYIVSDSDAPIENEKGIVDIYYQDTKGNNLSAKKVLSDRVGVAYKSNALKIENYKLKEIKGSESGTFKKEKQTIIYIYDYKKEPIKVVKKKIVKTGSEMFALSSMIIVLGLSIGVSNKRNN